MARKAGQITVRGQSAWLIRVYLGRDPQTETRKYHNQTIQGPFREAERFLNPSCSSATTAPLPRRCHEPQPIARPVAHDRGQGACQDEKVQDF
jgi:hypothetical protein